jgi:hypothetical protein
MFRPSTLRAAIAHSQRRTSMADTVRVPERHSEEEQIPKSREGEAVASRDADAK